MAKKPISTTTKKTPAKKPSDSKKETAAELAKPPKKTSTAREPSAARPSPKKKDAPVSTRKAADLSTTPPSKEKQASQNKQTAAKPTTVQSAAKVASKSSKKPVPAASQRATPARPSTNAAATTSLTSSKKVTPAPSKSPGLQPTAVATPQSVGKKPSSMATSEKSSILEKSADSSPEGRQPAAGKPGLGAKSEPVPTVKKEAKPRKPTPVEPPPELEAPSQPHSVHVEEPLPADQPALHEEQSPAPGHPSLFIVHITPEMAPVAKVGGLADVVFGLTRELAIRGNHVEIILPKYDNMRYDHIFDLQPDYHDLWVPWYEGQVHCTVYFGKVYDRKCFFIEPHSDDNFFNRGSIYGFKDDVLRYAFFSRAAMEFLWQAGKHPDIIHCHDWQTALAPVYLYEVYQRMGMTHPRACLTIHNFQHQGVTGGELLRATGLHQPERFFDYHRMHDNNHPNALNLLKAGIVYSNFVTTVSPHYAFETKDQGQGFGLEPTLHTHQIKYGGVVNGIDYDVWNPEVDGYIATRYGVDSIDAKYDNKRALRHRLMLADNGKPIVAFIGRLDPQKGLELVRHAIFYALERGAQFVLLGSSHDHGINSDFWGLKGMLNDSEDCHLEIGFDEELSHLIYAGADMMLVPSRFEPCGLTQLISLRYGTVPVVRSVGGLADTVFDKDHSSRPLHERNGYLFENYDQPGLESALGRAIACYFDHPDHFRELMKNAMRCDYSWNIPGRDYLNIYDYIREK